MNAATTFNHLSSAFIGRQVMRLRGDKTQEQLADLMRTVGFRWSQNTVWKVESGQRQLRLVEAATIATLTGNKIESLLGHATEPGTSRQREKHRRAHDRYDSALAAFTISQRSPVVGVERPGWCDDHEPVSRPVGDVRLTVTVEGEEDAFALAGAGLDLAAALVEVVDPERVRLASVEVECGAVVVKLHGHDGSPSCGGPGVAPPCGRSDASVGDASGVGPSSTPDASSAGVAS